MAYIIHQLKEFEVKTYEISKKVSKIGRKPSNDISLPDPFVSREHAEIGELEDGGYELRDLGGENPVKVNGRIISQHKLRDGDKLTLGQSLLIFKTEVPCPSTGVEMLAAEEMSQTEVEIAAVDAKKTMPFSTDDVDTKDVVSLQRDHQRLMLLYEFSKSVNSLLEDQDEMLEEIMNAALKTLKAERGFIALVDENTEELSCELVRSETGNDLSEKLEVSRTIVHKVLNEGVSIMTVNAKEDTQFTDAKSIQEYDIRSAVCAPLLFREEILGVVESLGYHK